MDEVHRILGYARCRGRCHRDLLVVRSQAGVAVAASSPVSRCWSLLGCCIKFGLLLISGAQPKEGLHLVYAAIAMAVLPLARSFVPATDRRAGIAALAAFVVLGFVLYRLFATG